MTHSNIFSECILFSLPFVVIAFKQARWPMKFLPLSALLLSILLMFIAQSRAVWVGGTLAVIVTLSLLLKSNNFSSIISFVKTNWKLLSISTVFIVLVFILFLKSEWPHIYSHLISLKNIDSSGRNYLWKLTNYIIKNNLLLGVGPGNWRFYILVQNHIAFQRPHNDYLWVFAESGIFAFTAFIGIFSYTLYKIIKSIKTIERGKLLTLYALLFGIIAYCTDSFFAFPKERPYLLILLALLFAFIHSVAPGKIVFNANTRLFAGVAFVFTIFSSWFCWNRMQGEITNKKIIQYVDLSPSEKMSMLKSINPFFYAADPFSSPIKFLEGSIWVDLGNFENAKKCYLDAHKMAPLIPDICNNIGSISEMTSDRATARTFYNKAIAIEPWNAQALLNLAVIEYKDGEKEKAVELVKKVNPNSITGQENLVTQYEILKSSLRL